MGGGQEVVGVQKQPTGSARTGWSGQRMSLGQKVQNANTPGKNTGYSQVPSCTVAMVKPPSQSWSAKSSARRQRGVDADRTSWSRCDRALEHFSILRC
jgi:hypothetical protein